MRQVAPEADGILGHDVLGRYNYLIDYERRRVRFGSFPAPADGVRLPLAWSTGRPVLQVRGHRGVYGLVLDSGADVLVMEAAAARDVLGAASGERRTATLQTHLGARRVDVEHHASLRLADLRLTAVDVVRLPGGTWAMRPEVGLLPASLLGRVYVSARRGEAVIWAK